MDILEEPTEDEKCKYRALSENKDNLRFVSEWRSKINIVKLHKSLNNIEKTIDLINRLENEVELKLSINDISYMVENFYSFDTTKNMLYLKKYITDNNCDRIFPKYSKYQSLQNYLIYKDFSELQKKSLLKFAVARLENCDYETLQKTYITIEELVIIKQKKLESIRLERERNRALGNRGLNIDESNMVSLHIFEEEPDFK